MDTLDPDSPREHGHDGNMQPVELGEYDSDGYFVGWIDADGQAWESRKEHDCSRTCGRYWDAFMVWNRAGGLLGPEPSAREIAEGIALPEHVDEAVAEAERQLDPERDIFAQMFVATQATLARLN